MRRTSLGIVSVLLMAGCASGTSPSPPASSPSDRPGYVDGIRIPTPAPTTAVAVVPAPTACPAPWRAIVAAAEPRGTVTVQTQTSADLITCIYRDRDAGPTGCSEVTAIVNTEPSAFEAFNRWVVEQGQNSMWGHDPALAPMPVSGVGVLADWAPGPLTFEASTTNNWVAVFLTCAAHRSGQEAVAEALARAGLASTA